MKEGLECSQEVAIHSAHKPVDHSQKDGILKAIMNLTGSPLAHLQKGAIAAPENQIVGNSSQTRPGKSNIVISNPVKAPTSANDKEKLVGLLHHGLGHGLERP